MHMHAGWDTEAHAIQYGRKTYDDTQHVKIAQIQGRCRASDDLRNIVKLRKTNQKHSKIDFKSQKEDSVRGPVIAFTAGYKNDVYIS